MISKPVLGPYPVGALDQIRQPKLIAKEAKLVAATLNGRLGAMEFKLRNGSDGSSVALIVFGSLPSLREVRYRIRPLSFLLIVAALCFGLLKAFLWALFDSHQSIDGAYFRKMIVGMDAESFGRAFPYEMQATWDEDALVDARRFVQEKPSSAARFSGELYIANASNVFNGPRFQDGRYVAGTEDLAYGWSYGEREYSKPPRPLKPGMTLRQVMEAVGPDFRMKLLPDPHRFSFEVDLPDEWSKLKGFTGTVSYWYLDHREVSYTYEFEMRAGRVTKTTGPPER